MKQFFHQRNRKTGISIGLTLLLLSMALLGCSSNTDSEEPEENVEVETDQEPTDDAQDQELDVTNLTTDQQNMLGPMGALIYYYSYEDEISDNQSVTMEWAADKDHWAPLCDLINGWGEDYDDGSDRVKESDEYPIMISDDFLAECASAMYADFDGNLPSTSESPKQGDGMGIWCHQDGYYCFGLGDWGEGSLDFSITAWTENADTTNTVEVQGTNYEGAVTADFQFTLEKNTYTEGEDGAFFTYAISSLKEATQADSGTDDYLLPDSDSRYYTEDELEGHDKDWLRLARNEIYARHGRIFDDEDLQEYFEQKSWYQGTVSADDFDDSVLNEYEEANIKTIKEVENQTS